MAYKYVALFALVAVVSAVEYHRYEQPVAAYQTGYKLAEPEAPAHYDFSYSVHDDHTGDIKEQKESRQGDDVHGSYSLIDADGYKRIVEYTADKHNGFNAVVHREPLGHRESYRPAKVAPVQYTKVAPIVQYQPDHYSTAPLKIASPVYSTPKQYDNSADAHVTFNGPAHNYHY